jgi:head-tail adaptor
MAPNRFALLNTTAVVRKKLITQDQYGNPQESYIELPYVRCRARELSANEIPQNGQLTNTKVMRFYMATGTDVDEADQIIWNGKLFEVINIDDLSLQLGATRGLQVDAKYISTFCDRSYDNQVWDEIISAIVGETTATFISALDTYISNITSLDFINLSAQFIETNCGNSEEWCSTYTTVQSNSAVWTTGFVHLSGDTMTGTLIAPTLSANEIYYKGETLDERFVLTEDASYHLVTTSAELSAASTLSGATSTNRTVVLIAPGTYNLSSDIVWGNEYVDLISFSGKRDVFITGKNIQFTADNIRVAGIDFTGTDDGFIYMGDNKPGQVYSNVKGGNWPAGIPGWWTGKTFAGELYDSEVGDFFGYYGTVSGTVRRNTIGDWFGNGGIVSGTVLRNTIGDWFGYAGTVSGTVGDNTIGDSCGIDGTVSGTIVDNTIGDRFGYDGTICTGTLRRNSFLGSYVVPIGCGQYIDCIDSTGKVFSISAIHDYTDAEVRVANALSAYNPVAYGQISAVESVVETNSANWDSTYSMISGSTIVTAVTSTGMFMTLNFNGSALAIPLYIY